MKKTEIESVGALQARMRAGLPLTGLIHQGLDLRDVAPALLADDPGEILGFLQKFL